MRPNRLASLALLTSLGVASAAGAQSLPRADASGSAGWFHARQPEISSYDEWYSQSAFLGGSAGWYWTPHLKTEVEVGATSSGDLYAYRELVVDGVRLLVNGRYQFSTRRVAVGQIYQFRDNAWMHPFVGAGLDYTSDRSSLRDDYVVAYDPRTGTPRVIDPSALAPTGTRHRLGAFAVAGAKAYFTERVFFRTDARLTFRSGVDEVVLRIGFGMDF